MQDAAISFEVCSEGGQPSVLMRQNGRQRILPALWLRERAPTPDQIDALTRQRFINPHELDPSLCLTSAKARGQTLALEFSDGYRADYDMEFLAGQLRPPLPLPARKVWDGGLRPPPRFAWETLDSDAGLFAAARAYLEYGFIIVTAAPTDADSIRDIAGRFGFIRQTNFGEIFEVRTKPNPNDLAYQPVALGPHTDNPYREPTPGIQLLHCLVNETSGGLSTLVDSLACVEALQKTNPDGVRLLCETPVRFSFDDPAASIHIERPMMAVDPAGRLIGLHYSPRLDWLPLMDEAATVAYHTARQQLSALFTDPKFELRFRLQPGECVMFDNNRVLHGRTAYNPNEGLRHLQGCYIDRDGPEILYRRLLRDGAGDSPKN